MESMLEITNPFGMGSTGSRGEDNVGGEFDWGSVAPKGIGGAQRSLRKVGNHSRVQRQKEPD